MELSVFRAKLKEVWEKADMEPSLRNIIVYDTDEWGDILIDEMGAFRFSSTKNQNWVGCYLNIKDVANLRFAKDNLGEPDYEGQEPYESYVRINFTTGERIVFCNVHERYTAEVTAYLIDNKITEDEFNELQEQCSTKELNFKLIAHVE